MSRTEGLVRVFVAYVVALFAGGLSFYWSDQGPLLDALVADLVATMVIFLFSRFNRNSSFYDAYWTVIPPFIALYWLVVGEGNEVPLREVLLMAGVLYWATRLTLNWAVHWEGMHHEDWRYQMLREKAPRIALLTDLFGIHLIPTLQVFAGLLPVYAVFQHGGKPIGVVDLAATIVLFGAVTVQMLADFQLRAFIERRKDGEHLNTGLWAWSRHPNYFGELGFWFGLFLFALAAYPEGWYWYGVGFVLMTLLFMLGSIPMMEKRSLERRPDYQTVIDSTSKLIPWPPRRK